MACLMCYDKTKLYVEIFLQYEGSYDVFLPFVPLAAVFKVPSDL